MKPLSGALLGIMAGALGLALPLSFDPFAGRAGHPVLPQIFLPLLGAGGGVSVPPCGGAVFALVQQNDALSGSCTTCTATLPSGPANGNMVLLITSGTRGSNPGPTVSAVSSTNTAWARDASQIVVGTRVDVELWHGLVSGGTGGTSVSVTWTQALASVSFTYNLSEWSGGVTSSPADGTAVINTNTSNTATTGSYSTGASCELVIAVQAQSANGGVSSFPGSPYTSLAQPNGGSAGSYNILSPIGSQPTATWVFTGSRSWASIIQGYLHP